MKELDLNGVIVELVKQFAQPIFTKSKEFSKNVADKLEVKLNLSLRKYLAANYERYSKTKTLLYRGAPVELRDFYVRTNLKFGKKPVEESVFIDEIKKNKRITVLGTAGSGKSTFCKSVFVELIEKPCGIFPIFIELRHLNTEAECSLKDYILKMLSVFEPDFSAVQLEELLKLGKILLIFDGFDEINNNKREVYEAELIALATKYRQILILVSSRPDYRFNSWEGFYQYDVLPLDKEKARELVERLDYDEQVKEKFLEVLDADLYDRHRSFAENPLLLTMMLLTYEQIAEIPNKIHLFYEQAFLTLFNKHDSLKSLYKRQSWSGLPLDEFKKILSAFSVLSYSDRKYSFSEASVLAYISTASEIFGIKVVPDLFLKDLLDNVCMLQRDGVNLTFTHRSFQEYFTALFLLSYVSNNKYELIDRVAFANDRDDVLPMVFDMSRDMLEQEWIIPRLEKLVEIVFSYPDTPEGRINYLKQFYDSIRWRGDDNLQWPVGLGASRNKQWAFFLVALFQFYRSELTQYTSIHFTALDATDEELINSLKPHQTSVAIGKYRSSKQILILGNSLLVLKVHVRMKFLKGKLEMLKAQYEKKQKDLSLLLLGK